MSSDLKRCQAEQHCQQAFNQKSNQDISSSIVAIAINAE